MALLSIVRWYNILTTALAQYIAALFIFNPYVRRIDILKDVNLHLIVLVTAFLIAAGYIINSFYDLERDMINRPRETVFDRVISKSFCLRCYLIFNSIGLIGSLFVSFNVFIYFFLFSIALWFYSHKLERIAVVKEISASLLAVASVLSIGLYYQHMTYMIALYAVLMILLLINREIIKDLVSEKGDYVFGYKTIPIRFGQRITYSIFVGLSALAVVVCILLLYYHLTVAFEVLIFIISLIIIWVAVLLKKPDAHLLKLATILYKIVVVIAILLSVYL